MPYRTLLLFPAIVLGCNAGKTQAVNGAPVLDAVTITAEPDPATSASTLTCTATARDPDGDPLTTVLTWSRESDGAELGAGDTLDLTTAPVAPDEVVVCSATVTDPRGAHAAGSDTVQLGNQDPTVGDLVVTTDTADERVFNDSTLACAGSVADPEDRGVSVAYTWENQTRGAPLDGGATVTLTAALATPGDALVCTAVATDVDGGVATNSVAVTVENRPPAIGIVTLSPAAPASPDDVSCEGSGTSDPDGDDVALALSWQRDGLDDTAGATLAAPHAVGSVLTCVVTATDDHGEQTTASADVTVANTAPTVDSVEITPTEARVDEMLTCSATASDVDGDVPAIRYAWSDGSAGATYTVVASDDPGDTITCTATAEDLRGGAAVGTAEATVANSVPVIAAVAISPATANNDDTLTCTATATDADGDAPGLTYTWTGSAAGSLGAGATLDLSATPVQSLETVACTATAADPDGGTAQDGAVLTVANRDPSVSVALDPAAGARRGDTLTCTASPADADGDVVGVSYSWTVDGIAWTGSGSTATASLLAGVFSKDQTVSCTATADDGKGGADAATTSTRIENTPPRLSTPALAPSTAYTDDTLAANVATSDDDGDSISLAFDWFVDGVRVQTGTANTLDGTLWFDRGQAVAVTVTADDGDDSTDASSATLSITNTPPTAPIVQIDPAEPIEGEDLSCSITTPSTDADGDAVAYRFSWDVDGTRYGSAIDDAASSRVDGADVGASQVWTCAVQADDGSDVSTVAQDTVTSTCLAGADATCAAQSCLAVQDAGASFGDGLYWIDPDGGGAFSAWCDMTHAGGGWTRVARLDRATDGYCGGDPSPSRDLSLDPMLGAGKLPDVRVRAVVSGSSYNEILYFTGEAGRAAYLYTPMLDPYDTTVSYTDYCTWTCADGASDSTTCGSEYTGCGFGGRGTGGNRKKLYMDAPSGAHAYALHSGGGFCGLDNRAGYTADVYVR